MYGDYGQVSPLDVMNWHISASFSSVQAKLLPSEVRIRMWGVQRGFFKNLG